MPVKGKRGIKPLDVVEDFEEPTFQEPPPPTDEEVDAFVAQVKLPRSERKVVKANGETATIDMDKLRKAAKTVPEKLKEPKKQESFPAMADKHLEDLEDAAREYADIRDKRISLLRDEVHKKELLLNLMHRHKKQAYRCDDVSIEVVQTPERVKVRILDDED